MLEICLNCSSPCMRIVILISSSTSLLQLVLPLLRHANLVEYSAGAVKPQHLLAILSIFPHGAATSVLSPNSSITLTPSGVTTLTVNPLKSIGNLLFNSSLHILNSFKPCSRLISG